MDLDTNGSRYTDTGIGERSTRSLAYLFIDGPNTGHPLFIDGAPYPPADAAHHQRPTPCRLTARNRYIWMGHFCTPVPISRTPTFLPPTPCLGPIRESVLFIGTQFSNLYTAVDTIE